MPANDAGEEAKDERALGVLVLGHTDMVPARG
jgi:hypothetical protein